MVILHGFIENDLDCPEAVMWSMLWSKDLHDCFDCREGRLIKQLISSLEERRVLGLRLAASARPWTAAGFWRVSLFGLHLYRGFNFFNEAYTASGS